MGWEVAAAGREVAAARVLSSEPRMNLARTKTDDPLIPSNPHLSASDQSCSTWLRSFRCFMYA